MTFCPALKKPVSGGSIFSSSLTILWTLRIQFVSAGRPKHGLEPVKHLQAEEEDEPKPKIRMHRAAERPSAKDGREPPKQPRQINAKPSKEREEEEERHRPVDECACTPDGAAVLRDRRSCGPWIRNFRRASSSKRSIAPLAMGRISSRTANALILRRFRLRQARASGYIVREHAQKSEERERAEHRFEEPFPDRIAPRNGRILRQAAVALGIGGVVQNIDNMGSADGRADRIRRRSASRNYL